MKRRFLLVNSSVQTGQVTEQRIGNKDYYVISGAGSIVGNTVMNGIYYPLDEVKKLANSNVGRVISPVSHPKSENNDFVSAADPVALNDYGIGAFSFNYRMDGDRLIRDIAVPKESGANSDKHALVVQRVQNHEDMDTSTGVYFEPLQTKGIGSDGEEYGLVAKNLYLDHDALLPFEVGASTTSMGTGLFANSDGETSKIYEYNASISALNLPLAPLDTEWNESEADQLIRQFTNSGEEPSSTYRRFHLNFDRNNVKSYDGYQMPFATIINGRPHAVLSAIENAAQQIESMNLSDDDKSRAKRVIETYQNKAKRMQQELAGNSKSIFANAWNAIKKHFAKNELSHDKIYSAISGKLNADKGDERHIWPYEIYEKSFIYRDSNGGDEVFYRQGYHITSNDEIEFDGEPEKVNRTIKYETATNGDNDMSLLKAALNKAGVNTDGMTEEQLYEAHNKMIIENAMKGGSGEGEPEDKKDKKKGAGEMAGNSSEPPEWFKPYVATLNAINANAASELDKAAKQVAALNMGITEESAKAMGLQACNDVISKNSGVVNFAGGAPGFSTNSQQEEQFDLCALTSGEDK